MLYLSKGILKYSQNQAGHYKLIVEIDPEISRYYRSFIPKYIQYNPQMYDPHISVVRKEIPVNLDYWGRYDGQSIEFLYDNTIHFGTVYVWLNCFSKQLETIRLELGLPVSTMYTRPPEGFIKCFHSTLGNFKSRP